LTRWASDDWRALKRLVSKGPPADLRARWSRLEPVRKAALFKLMEPEAAMGFYRELPFEERYFLLGAFDAGAIAPILEGLSPRERSLFHRLSRDCFDEMLEALR
jgi:Mg/Co/Ni transporter MgtE